MRLSDEEVINLWHHNGGSPVRWDDLNPDIQNVWSKTIFNYRMILMREQFAKDRASLKEFIKANRWKRGMAFSSTLVEGWLLSIASGIEWKDRSVFEKKFYLAQVRLLRDELYLEEELDKAKCTLEELRDTMTLQRRPENEPESNQVLRALPDHAEATTAQRH